MKSENIHGEVTVGSPGERDRMPQLPNGDFFNLIKLDDVDLITIDYAIRSDIKQLQPIEFDIIFTEQINRVETLNYIPVNITNQKVATTVDNGELEDYSLCLEYEVNDCLGYTKLF